MVASDVAPLWDELKKIRDGQVEQGTLLSTHMENSARHSEEIRGEVHEIRTMLDRAVSDTQKLYSAMPEDEHGRPSLFIHKNQHGTIADGEREKRSEMADRRKIRASFWNSAAMAAGKIMVGLAVMIILGEKAQYLLKLIGG